MAASDALRARPSANVGTPGRAQVDRVRERVEQREEERQVAVDARRACRTVTAATFELVLLVRASSVNRLRSSKKVPLATALRVSPWTASVVDSIDASSSRC